MAGEHQSTRGRLRWVMVAILSGAWLVPAPGGAMEAGPAIPTNERGEPLFVTGCDGGVVQDIPYGALQPEPGPIYPPELSARIAEALESTMVELRTVENLEKLDLPPAADTPWVETVREELAAGEGPIQAWDVRKEPWPELRREMAEIFDRYYDWCVRELPNGDIERELLVKTWPLPWLS